MPIGPETVMKRIETASLKVFEEIDKKLSEVEFFETTAVPGEKTCRIDFDGFLSSGAKRDIEEHYKAAGWSNVTFERSTPGLFSQSTNIITFWVYKPRQVV